MHMDVINMDRAKRSFFPVYLPALDALIPKICKHCNNFMEIKQINLTEAVRQCYKCSASSQCVDVGDIEFFHRSYRDIDKNPKDWESYFGTEEDELNHLQSWIEHFTLTVSKYEDSCDDETSVETNAMIRITFDDLPTMSTNDLKINEVVDSLRKSEMSYHETNSEWSNSVIDELDAALEEISNQKSNLRDLPFPVEDLFPPEQHNVISDLPTIQSDFPHSHEARTSQQGTFAGHPDGLINRAAELSQNTDTDQGSETSPESELFLCDVSGKIVKKSANTVNQNPNEASHPGLDPEQLLTDNSQITCLDKKSGEIIEITCLSDDVPDIIAEEIIVSTRLEEDQAVFPDLETQLLTGVPNESEGCNLSSTVFGSGHNGGFDTEEIRPFWKLESSLKSTSKSYARCSFKDANSNSHGSTHCFVCHSSVNPNIDQGCVCDDKLIQLCKSSTDGINKHCINSGIADVTSSVKQQEVEKELTESDGGFSELDKIIFGNGFQSKEKENLTHLKNSENNIAVELSDFLSETPSVISTASNSMCSEPRDGSVRPSVEKNSLISVDALLSQYSVNFIPEQICVCDDKLTQLSPASDSEMNNQCVKMKFPNLHYSSMKQQRVEVEEKEEEDDDDDDLGLHDWFPSDLDKVIFASLPVPLGKRTASSHMMCHERGDNSTNVSMNASFCSFSDDSFSSGMLITVPASEDITSEMLASVSMDDIPIDFEYAATETISYQPPSSNGSLLCREEEARISLFDVECSGYSTVRVDIDTSQLCLLDKSSRRCPQNASAINNGDGLGDNLLHDGTSQLTMNPIPCEENSDELFALASSRAFGDPTHPADEDFHAEKANVQEEPHHENFDGSWPLDNTNMPDKRQLVVEDLATRNTKDFESFSSSVMRWDNYSKSKRYQDLKDTVTETFDELESFSGTKFKPSARRKKREVTIPDPDRKFVNLLKVMQHEVEVSSAEIKGELPEGAW